jgi:hypothetical protein
VLLIGDSVHLLPGIEEGRLLGENLGIDEFIEGWDRVRLGIVLENMIGILELEVIGEGQEIPALMEERPEVCAI